MTTSSERHGGGPEMWELTVLLNIDLDNYCLVLHVHLDQ